MLMYSEGTTAHPWDEHSLPLLVALGVDESEVASSILYRGSMDGALRVAAYAFG